MSGSPPEVPLLSSRTVGWLQHALLRPVWTLIALAAVALTIEVCQQWPEFFFPGHAIGEFVRNLAYALIGAVLFNWILIEIPAQRRRRSAYSRNLQALKFLVQAGPLTLAWFRGAGKRLSLTEREPDGWDQSSLTNYVHDVYKKNVQQVSDERRKLLVVNIQAVQLMLDGLDSASYFFDSDVALALAHYPATKGINQLQPPAPDDPEPWKRDAHITWELLQASRRLNDALTANAPYLELDVETGGVTFSDGLTEGVRTDDLVQAAS